MNTATKIIVSIGTVAVIATAGVGAYVLSTTDDSVTNTTQASSSAVSSTKVASTATPVTTSEASVSNSSTSGYKDGTYTATATYNVPKGEVNSISATITVSDGKISAVTTDNSYTDRESGMYIDSFESGVSSSTVGTTLADATFSRIGGASLTTDGFNAVLDTIRTQATA